LDINEARNYIREFVHTKSYEALGVWMESEIDRLHEKMELVRDPYELGLLQGRIKNYRQMLQLEREVTNL